MLKSEFEKLVGRNVTDNLYRAIESIYMESDLTKQEFCRVFGPVVDAIRKPYRDKMIKCMKVRDRSGFEKTPNGCWFHVKYVELVDIDVSTGRYVVAPLSERDIQLLVNDGVDLNLSTWFDFDYTDCNDTDGQPISLNN